MADANKKITYFSPLSQILCHGKEKHPNTVYGIMSNIDFSYIVFSYFNENGKHIFRCSKGYVPLHLNVRPLQSNPCNVSGFFAV